MSNVASSPAPVTPPNLPPMPQVFSPPPIVPLTPTIQQEHIDIDGESTLKEVKSILIDLLDNSPELGNKADDIRRRMDVMENMWTSGKLNNRIFLQMKNLAHGKPLCNYYIYI